MGNLVSTLVKTAGMINFVHYFYVLVQHKRIQSKYHHWKTYCGRSMGKLMDSLLVSHERQSVGAIWENHSWTETQKYVKELLDCITFDEICARKFANTAIYQLRQCVFFWNVYNLPYHMISNSRRQMSHYSLTYEHDMEIHTQTRGLSTVLNI